MVLYRKKQVTIQRPRPLPTDLNTEIFLIPQTNEWFTDYEDYLARMDFYKRHKFSCEISGSSCLTFFEAYASEQKEYADADANFPESLREHILKFLQFNKVTRLDLLVDKIYLLFKTEYFPGEEVFVKKIFTTTSDTKKGIPASSQPEDPNVHSYISTVKQRGIIREKVQYSNPSDTKYLVSIIGEGSQVIATNQQISRDRNHFTKWLIKVFIKMTVTRSYMSGSPWVVKKKFAKKYRIPREFPEEFKQYESSTPTGSVIYDDDYEILGMVPAETTTRKVRGKYKPRGTNALSYNALGAIDPAQLEAIIGAKTNPKHELRLKFPAHHLPPLIQREIMENNVLTISSFQPSKKTLVEDLTLQFDLQTSRPIPLILLLPDNALSLHKLIAEELEDEFRDIDDVEMKTEDGSHEEKDITTETDEKEQKRIDLRKKINELKRESLGSVQEALECWMFLNIYHSVLKLDTFTFDDFLYAMSWNGDQFNKAGRCELLDEIWCALLGAIVSNQIPSSKIVEDAENIYGLQITLPINSADLNDDLVKEEDGEGNDKGSESDSEAKPSKLDEDESEDEASSVDSRSRNTLPKTFGGNSTAVDEDGDADDEEEVIDEENSAKRASRTHNAYQVMNHRGTPWYERLRKRNFKDGNWQLIVLGVLSLVEYVPEFYSTIQETYRTLAPKGAPCSPSSVLNRFYHYCSLDLRLKVLSILVSLVVSGPLVRNYIEDSLESTTAYRREKLEIYKDLKVCIENANKIHTEIYEKLMDGANTATDPQLWQLFTRKKHRLNLAGYEMTDYEKDLLTKDPTFQECWDKREAAITKIKEMKLEKKKAEMQLSQIDCQRVSLLGKDRHYNRYWWFENNGLPNLHSSGTIDEDDEQQEPESEDEFDDKDKDENQDETYLMGRLWIQGPYSMDVMQHMKLDREGATKLSSLFNADLEESQKSRFDASGTMKKSSEPEYLDLEDGGPPLKVMDFRNLPQSTTRAAQELSISYGRDKILSNNGTELIDRLGALSAEVNVLDLNLLSRKFLEERPAPLISGDQWMYFEKAEELDDLLKWLNPWGKRESVLRKEILRIKEGAASSISARRKALWLDKIPKEDVDIDSQIEAVEAKLLEKKFDDDVKEVGHEETDEGLLSRKRGRRNGDTPVKRQKTTEETINSGSTSDLSKLLDELKDKKRDMKKQIQVTRVLEWINSAARDEFNKSLYEGGDKSKEKPKKGKR